MRTGEAIAATLWLAVALGIAAAGYDLRLGVLNDPGPGFMIFWIGVAMALLAAANLGAALRQPVGAGLAALWANSRWQIVVYVTLLLIAYATLLPTLGFPLVTALLLLVLFKTVEPQGWIAAIIGAAVTTAAAYLVFARFLGTQLPMGSLWAG